MSRKYHTFAVGWQKEHNTKGPFLSCSPSGNKEGKIKLKAELSDGRTVDIDSFVVWFNNEKPSEKFPDAQFVFIEE